MRPLSFVCGLIATLCLSASSVAEESRVKLVAFQYPPLVYLEQGLVRGKAVDLVREVFAEMGITMEVKVLPWARALQYMEHGQADGVFTIFRTPERERFLRYAETALIEQEIRLYTHTARPIEYGGQLSDLAPYRIGVTRAVSYGPRFDQAAEGLLRHVSYVNDEASKFLLLDKGRVDVVVSSTDLADFYLKQLGLAEAIKPLAFQLERVPSYLAFSRASPRQSLAPQFEATLERLKASGRYRQILEQPASRPVGCCRN